MRIDFLQKCLYFICIFDIGSRDNDMKEIKEENNSNSKSSNEIETRSVNWTAILFYIYLYLLGFIGLYFLFKAKWMTIFYCKYRKSLRRPTNAK